MENKILIMQRFDGCEPRKFEGEFIMDLLKEILGDGNLKITLGRTFSDKEFGNGGETFMSVTITCNQDKGTALTAADIARQFINEQLPRLHTEGLAIWAEQKMLNKQVMKA